jgi:hypothetical protein
VQAIRTRESRYPYSSPTQKHRVSPCKCAESRSPMQRELPCFTTSRLSVREVAVEGRAARFDAKGMRHHHFICNCCGNVEDVKWYDVPRPASGTLGKRRQQP